MRYNDEKRCNRDKCLRKFRSKNTGVSEWCGIIGDEEDNIKPSSKDCPLYCDKFFCYQTKRIIKRYENVYWISDTPMNDSYKNTYRIKARDVKFSGLSKEGQERANKERDFDDSHYNKSNIVCPYCDTEIDDWWDLVGAHDYNIDVECPDCEKEFTAQVNRTITFTTRMPEDREDV